MLGCFFRSRRENEFSYTGVLRTFLTSAFLKIRPGSKIDFSHNLTAATCSNTEGRALRKRMQIKMSNRFFQFFP